MAARNESSVTEILAAMAVEVPTYDLPEAAVHAASKMLLDAIASAIGGWNAPGVLPVLEQMREWSGAEQSSVLVHGDRMPAPHAAFVNSVLIHGLDFDDLYRRAALHITSSVVPCALATAELTGSAGRELLAAIVLGVEVAARLGILMEPHWGEAQGQGFLPSSVIGGFGATAAASRLLGHNVDTAAHALGIYYSQAAGNRQALYDVTLTKRIQPALATRSALWSAFLADRGITGPHRAVEGEAGLARIYAGSEQPLEHSRLHEFPHGFQIEQLAIKRFPSCGACHPLTQAALDLVGDSPVSPDQIESITVYLGEGGNAMVGRKFEIGETPQVNAQFSVGYGVALGLLYGDAGVQRFDEGQIRADLDAANLASRVTILDHLQDPLGPVTNDDDEPSWVDERHVLTVRLVDGTVMTRSSSIREVLSPEKSDFALASAKLRDCAKTCPGFDAAKINSIIDAAKDLGSATRIGEFVQLCIRDQKG